MCDTHYQLVNNNCLKCEVSNCDQCMTNSSGPLLQCALCSNGFHWNAGLCFVNTGSSSAGASGANGVAQCRAAYCKTCQSVSAEKCETCLDSYMLDGTGKCVSSCTVTHCDMCYSGSTADCKLCSAGYTWQDSQCVTALGCRVGHCAVCFREKSSSASLVDNSTCATCDTGYTPSNGYCEVQRPCAVTNCAVCDTTLVDKCVRCEEGYGLVNGTCVKCADPYCRHCDINPSRCAKCVDRMIPDSVTGKCINSGDCSVANCKVCDATSAVLCNTCNDGYYLSLNRSACLQASTTTSTTTPTAPCNVPNCLTCYPNDGNVCQYCRSGYYTFNGQCVPIGNCYVGNCAQCMLRDGTKCSTCRNGYFLSSTYTCLSQHVNVNGAAAPHSLWLAAVAVLLASAVTHLA